MSCSRNQATLGRTENILLIKHYRVYVHLAAPKCSLTRAIFTITGREAGGLEKMPRLNLSHSKHPWSVSTL